MPEILKPRCLHANDNLVFGVCTCKLLFSCKKQMKGCEVELTAIIQRDEAQFSTETCIVNGTWVREHVSRSH